MKIESVETCFNPDDPDWEPHSEEEGKKKRDARVIFSPEQISILEAHYEDNAFPKADLREKIGEELGLTAKKVDVWFKNRRAKAKREGREGVQKIVKQGPSLAENQLNLPNESNENKGVKYNKTGGNARRVQIPAPENNNFEVLENCKMSSQSLNERHLIEISPEFQSVIFQILSDAP